MATVVEELTLVQLQVLDLRWVKIRVEEEMEELGVEAVAG